MKWIRSRSKTILLWSFFTCSLVYGVWNYGPLKTVENVLFAFTWYYITIGAFDFFLVWLPRYIRIKRFQKKNPGLFYLVLVKEAFQTK